MTNPGEVAPIDAPDVSVVIVSWNTRALLLDALASLYETTTGVSFEVIVVDNASEDGTSEAVDEKFPDVRLLRLETNRGFTGGNNAGFEIARGRYVLLLNSDTIVLPTTIAPLVYYLDDHPGAGCVGAKHLNADGSLQRSMDDEPTLLPDALYYTELHRVPAVRRWLTRSCAWWSDHEVEQEAGWVNGACLMVRRVVIAEVGGLDERLFIYGEELDWCHRMRQAGWSVHFIPSAEVIHLGGQAMDSAADRRAALLMRGQLHFYQQHHNRRTATAFRAVIALTAIVRLVAIHLVWASEAVGRRRHDAAWSLVTTERVRVQRSTATRMWVDVLQMCVRTA
jgi:GT2 family glycosyltransferase